MYEIIIREFVTLRGFAFATSVVELGKKLSGKNLQKNKGLRKTIPNNLYHHHSTVLSKKSSCRSSIPLLQEKKGL